MHLLFYDESFPYAGIRPNRESIEKFEKEFTIVSALDLEKT